VANQSMEKYEHVRTEEAMVYAYIIYIYIYIASELLSILSNTNRYRLHAASAESGICVRVSKHDIE
jgi:hypothetical protein